MRLWFVIILGRELKAVPERELDQRSYVLVRNGCWRNNLSHKCKVGEHTPDWQLLLHERYDYAVVGVYDLDNAKHGQDMNNLVSASIVTPPKPPIQLYGQVA